MKTNQYFLTLPILFTIFLSFPSQTFAQSHVGTLTSLKGDVKILSRKLASGSKVLRYEGETYSYKKARIGRRVKPKQILLTGSDGKAKVVYPNGDHFNIGPGSSMTIPSKGRGRAKKGTKLKLYYGKVRALISKKGPRRDLLLRTKTAVAGVRGTDFYLSASGTEGTKLTVMRGSVVLAKDSSKRLTIPSARHEKNLFKKAITVKKGFTASLGKVEDLPPTTDIAPQPVKALTDGEALPEPSEMAKKAEKNPRSGYGIKLTPATKEALIEVERISTISPTTTEPTPIDESVREEIENLQKKSAAAVMDDIKDDDPQLYKALIKQKISKANEVNSAVVAKLFKKAPREKVKRKLSEEELKNMDSVYKKFFKSNN